MTGLLAARVLAGRFDKVTLIERDPLKAGPEPRKGAPQTRHTHVLLARGAEVLEQLFPGLFEELLAEGAQRAEMADAAWFHFGAWKARARTGVMAYLQSRGLLEWKVRQRVLALGNLELRDGFEALGYLATPGGERITGLRLRRPGTSEEQRLEGVDLVVDASGRGSQAPRWLQQLGYPAVEEELVRVDLGYTSRVFLQPPETRTLGWRIMAIYPSPPHERRFGYLSPIEGGRWMVSLGGWLGEHAPVDEAGFLEFARSLPRPDIYEAIRNAQPEGPAVIHKFPGSQWRRYERLPRFPRGLVVLGDALCSFSPVYGQGMTTGALQVLLLEEYLRTLRLDDASECFRREVSRLLRVPWLMATGEDLRYPEVAGERPWSSRLVRWYANRLHALGAHDPVIVRGFVGVMHMLKSPLSLLSPPILWRVLTSRAEDLQAAPAAVPASPVSWEER